MTKKAIKFINSLADRKNREESQTFVVEGPKMFEELLKSDFVIEKLFTTDANIPFPESIPSELISDAELKRISQLKTASSILALVKIPLRKTQQYYKDWTIALDNIQDPGNMGTIIRIADWFGIHQIVASVDSVDCYNSKVVQATMGSIFRVNVLYRDLSLYLSECKLPVYGALLDGKNIFEQRKLSKGILVIGNESKGISEAIKKYITIPLTIPRIGQAESLNAAVATGILTALLTAN